MKLFRNPEVRKSLYSQLAAVAAFTAAGFFIRPLCGWLMLLLGTVLILLHLLSVYRRYQKIAELSELVDRILHGQEEILISDGQEGELAILRSEIQKMSVRLKENAELLKQDKKRLADAIADISHQLRTPLTSLNLTASLLSGEELSDEKRVELAYRLRKQLQQIDWLIEALLKTSKIDANAVQFLSEPVSVRALIDQTVQPFLIPMELLEQELLIHAADETFTGDLSWTAEALGNIVKNCMEHTPPGGRIEITASETALYTEIVVHDSGEGFAKQDIPHLFERFYKGQNASASSVGIGLALARMIITAQNGTIRAGNAIDGGALFSVRFYKSVI